MTSPLRDPRWATRITDLLERGVGSVRDVATRPVAMVVRAIVFSLVIGTGVVVATVLLLVALARGVPVLIADGRRSGVLLESVKASAPGTWIAR